MNEKCIAVMWQDLANIFTKKIYREIFRLINILYSVGVRIQKPRTERSAKAGLGCSSLWELPSHKLIFNHKLSYLHGNHKCRCAACNVYLYFPN